MCFTSLAETWCIIRLPGFDAYSVHDPSYKRTSSAPHTFNAVHNIAAVTPLPQDTTIGACEKCTPKLCRYTRKWPLSYNPLVLGLINSVNGTLIECGICPEGNPSRGSFALPAKLPSVRIGFDPAYRCLERASNTWKR